MNTDAFTGKANDYATSRPSYPEDAIDYIRSLVSADAVFADIGAGTGKFTELIAHCGYKVFAVEPNDDMRTQLSVTMEPFSNAIIINSTAEATKLPDHSVDVITCAQALGWFDLSDFQIECLRIGKLGATVFSLYNSTPGDNYIPGSHRLSSRRAAESFFKNPIIRKFSNPIFYTRERWISHNASISDSLQTSDDGYKTHSDEISQIFDLNNIDGFLRVEMETTVHSESIERTFKNDENDIVPGLWDESYANGEYERLFKAAGAKNGEDGKHCIGAICGYYESGDDSFPYIICALKKPGSDTTGFHTANIPKFTWAVFRSGVSEHMGTEIINMYNRAHSEWLPSSGYDKASGPDMEVYYDAPGSGYFQEVWIPVTKKEND
ncbi:MAG: GyrI-like domain-containing protein [Oscillospiraceae bacterium]|nr:GyrI-like domain-containing protein [Oscillospiraceae bacterium]